MEPVVCMNPNNNKYNGWSRTLSSSNKIKQELQEKFKQQQQLTDQMRSRADSLSNSGQFSHGTLPRSVDQTSHRLSVSSHNIADVEKMYMAMKNLNNPLPTNTSRPSDGKMPALYNLNKMPGSNLVTSLSM